jgi:hypothetical protein
MHHSIDISPLTQLRSIGFTVIVGAHPSQWPLQILLCISSARLEDVEFDLDFTFSNDIANTLEWNSVDAILQRSTFSRLRNVYFRQLLSPTAHTSIVQHLPLCHARGILRFDLDRR